MEPIPEEELEIAALTTAGSSTSMMIPAPAPASAPSSARTVKKEQKSRLTEVYTSEQVDTLVSTVPKAAVPDSWKLANDEVYIDPSMSSTTYVTEALAGPTSARGSTYSYTYESHYDEPSTLQEEERGGRGNEINIEEADENDKMMLLLRRNAGSQNDSTTISNNMQNVLSTNQNDNDNMNDHDNDLIIKNTTYKIDSGGESTDGEVERLSTQTQKITRVTKVTTTRSVRQLPITIGSETNFYFDADGSPMPLADSDGRNAATTSSAVIYENVPYSDAELMALGIDLSSKRGADRRSANLDDSDNARTTRHAAATTTTATSTSAYSSSAAFNTPSPAPAASTYTSEVFMFGVHGKSAIGPSYNEEELTRTISSSVHYDLPARAGTPQITNVGANEIDLSWLEPEPTGPSSEPVLGYQVELRRIGSNEWIRVFDFLIKDTHCTISNLDPIYKYEFRIVSANSFGFGLPSMPSTIVQLKSHYDSTTNIGEWRGTIPGRPYVCRMDSDRVTLEWAPAVADPDVAPVAGYEVEYRTIGMSDWLQSNDYLVGVCHYEVQNLRPNGEYEFRVRARSADAVSDASPSSGIVRIKPAVPSRGVGTSSIQSAIDLCPPGQPQVEELDTDWVKLRWDEAGEPNDAEYEEKLTYIVEYREIGDPLWYTANTTPIHGTTYTVSRLRASSTYEFRVLAYCEQTGSYSLPSPSSEIVQLRPTLNKPTTSTLPPSKPLPPEYVDFEGTDRVTLCWFPAASSLPIDGYDVEFRDYQQDSAWYRVNELLIHSCKMTVGDLIVGHEYQFRVIARNAIGYSEPSDASPPIFIGAPAANGGDTKYIEAERYGPVPLLQDEMVRESPPLPDRDDSPPPINRRHLMKGKDGLHWRDPTLREVIEYLESKDKVEQLNASGYLQHLTFNDNAIKEETRELKGIPKLVKLLDSDVSDIQKNACGCLKNLSFGKENDNNKRAIRAAGGIAALTTLLTQTSDAHVREEDTAVLWNLSSCDDLKTSILDQCSDAIVQSVIVPGSGIDNPPPEPELSRSNSNVFRNGTGVLRNVSAASVNARKMLRAYPRLVDSLVHFLSCAILSNHVDARTVENVVCILRNLSYRIQEVEDPNYDPRMGSSESGDRSARERSRSAPSGSPKPRKKDAKKKKKAVLGNNDPMNQRFGSVTQSPYATGAELLWQPELVKLYLKLLQESSNSDILEASAGAIQNLAACDFEPSVAVRACVRTEKGLPVLVELLRLNDDKVVCAVTTALRNLALDQRNRELIGKYAMKDLVSKLPRPDQKARDGSVSDATIGAVLGILFETVKHSADFTRNVHECGGTERLRYLARSHPMYSARICKYASQVLYVMWQHKELHDGFKRGGLKESDFYSGTTSRARDSTTLARPISSQGAERPANLRSENMDDSGSGGAATGRYGTMGSTFSVGGGGLSSNRETAMKMSSPDYSTASAGGQTTSYTDRYSVPPQQQQQPSSRSVTPQSATSHHPPLLNTFQQQQQQQQHQLTRVQATASPSMSQHYATSQTLLHQPVDEPLYASVHKRNGHRSSTGADSWV